MDEIERELTQAAAEVRANQQALDRRDRAIIAAAKAGMKREPIADLAGVTTRRVFQVAAKAGAVGPPGRPGAAATSSPANANNNNRTSELNTAKTDS